jgi:hypothetical protein
MLDATISTTVAQWPPTRTGSILRAVAAIEQARALRLNPPRTYVARDKRGRPQRISTGNSHALWLGLARFNRVMASMEATP